MSRLPLKKCLTINKAGSLTAILLLLLTLSSPAAALAVSGRGDVNNDKFVNSTDLSQFLSNHNPANAAEDFNFDGLTNVLDMSILMSNFGSTTNQNQTLGSAINHFQLADPQYTDIIKNSFDSVTVEYEWQMNVTEPNQQGSFDFSLADQVVAWAQANNKKIRGHNIIWGEQLPGWLTGRSWTKAELLDIEKQLVQTTVSHNQGAIKSWNVVNEAFNDDGTLRPNFWESTIGPEYIANAFTWAHQADPNAKLFINDYSAEHTGAKVDAIYNLVSQLKSQGVPINGVAFQGHLVENWQPDRNEFIGILNRFGSLGLQTEITELDVKTSVGSGTTAEKLAQEAQMYLDMAAACQVAPSCVGVTTWGINDAYSWLGPSEMALPFDSNYQPKLAFYRLITGLSR
jgi:endo-1,4-beta-xylanase